jgi:hypothetical protein
LPIEALFWGDWWLSSEGVDRQSLIIDRLQAVIASPYFSELAQIWHPAAALARGQDRHPAGRTREL